MTLSPTKAKNNQGPYFEYLEEGEAVVDSEDDSEPEALGALNRQKLLHYPRIS